MKNKIKNKYLTPDERYPPIPCKKVMLHAKDKKMSRKARRKEERDAFYEHRQK